MKKILVIMLTVLFSVFAVNAMALTTYNDRTSWENNVTGITTENFDALPENFYQTLTLGAVTFDVPNSPYPSGSDLWISTPGLYPPIGYALVGNYWMTTVRGTFNPQTTAVGVDVANLVVNDTIAIAVIDNNQTFTYNLQYTYPNPFFFGVTADNGSISSISFSPANGFVGIDNFSYGSGTSNVPEPTTMLLLGLGLVGLAGVRRKFQN